VKQGPEGRFVAPGALATIPALIGDLEVTNRASGVRASEAAGSEEATTDDGSEMLVAEGCNCRLLSCTKACRSEPHPPEPIEKL
jgi:hypothetical protein